MAPRRGGLEDLVWCSLEEVAFGGEAGVGLDRLWAIVARADHRTEAQLDDRYKRFLWGLLSSSPDFVAGEAAAVKKYGYDDLPQHPDLRVSVKASLQWQALTGHDIDSSRFPPSEFTLLSLIGAAGLNGILQPDLVQLSGQDKRSVPKRTDALVSKGVVIKRQVLARKMKTSLLVLRRFVDREDEQSEEAAQEREKNKTFGGSMVDFEAFLDRVMSLVRTYNMASISDLRKTMGITQAARQFQWKALNYTLRSLEKLGFLMRCTAKTTYDGKYAGMQKCVKYLRELNEVGMELMLKGVKSVQQIDISGIDTVEDIEEEGSEEEGVEAVVENQPVNLEDAGELAARTLTEVARVKPLYVPTDSFPAAIFSFVASHGPGGVKSMDLRVGFTGDYYKRVLEGYVVAMSNSWQTSTPNPLRHLSLIRDFDLTYKNPHYRYYTFNDFAQLVKEKYGQTEFNVLQPNKSGRGKEVKVSLANKPLNNKDGMWDNASDQEYGFVPIDKKRLHANRAASLQTCSKYVPPKTQKKRPSKLSKETTPVSSSTPAPREESVEEQSEAEVVLPITPVSNTSKRNGGTPSRRNRKYEKGKEPYNFKWKEKLRAIGIFLKYDRLVLADAKKSGKKLSADPVIKVPGSTLHRNEKGEVFTGDRKGGMMKELSGRIKWVWPHYGEPGVHVQELEADEEEHGFTEEEWNQLCTSRTEAKPQFTRLILSIRHDEMKTVPFWCRVISPAVSGNEADAPNSEFVIDDDSIVEERRPGNEEAPYKPARKVMKRKLVLVEDEDGKLLPRKRGRPKKPVHIPGNPDDYVITERTIEPVEDGEVAERLRIGRKGPLKIPPIVEILSSASSGDDIHEADSALADSPAHKRQHISNANDVTTLKKKAARQTINRLKVSQDPLNKIVTMWTAPRGRPMGRPENVPPKPSGRLRGRPRKQPVREMVAESGLEDVTNGTEIPSTEAAEAVPVAPLVEQEDVEMVEAPQGPVEEDMEITIAPGSFINPPLTEEQHTSLLSALPRGLLGIRRRDTFMKMLRMCGGVCPGDHEMKQAFRSLWKVECPGAGMTDWRTVLAIVKGLILQGRIKQTTFSWTPKNHTLKIRKSMFYEADIPDTDKRVTRMRSRIIQANGHYWWPPESGVESKPYVLPKDHIDGRKLKEYGEQENDVQLWNKPSGLEKRLAKAGLTRMNIEERKQRRLEAQLQAFAERERREREELGYEELELDLGIDVQNLQLTEEEQALQRRKLRDSVRSGMIMSETRARQAKSLTGGRRRLVSTGSGHELRAPPIEPNQAVYGEEGVFTNRTFRSDIAKAAFWDMMEFEQQSDQSRRGEVPAYPTLLGRFQARNPRDDEDVDMDNTDIGPRLPSSRFPTRKLLPELRSAPPKHRRPPAPTRLRSISGVKSKPLQSSVARILQTIFNQQHFLLSKNGLLHHAWTAPAQPFHSSSGTFGTTFFIHEDLVLMYLLRGKAGRLWSSTAVQRAGRMIGAKRRVLDAPEVVPTTIDISEQFSDNDSLQGEPPSSGRSWRSESMQVPFPLPRAHSQSPEPQVTRKQKTASSLHDTGMVVRMLGEIPVASKEVVEPLPAGRVRRREPNLGLSTIEFERLLFVFIAVRSLTGGTGANIDWAVLLKLYPQYDLAKMKKAWVQLKKGYNARLPKLHSDFQRAFLRDYESGVLPIINLDNPADYDWNAFADWGMQNVFTQVDAPVVDLPRTGEELRSRYEVVSDSIVDESGLRESLARPSIVLVLRPSNAAQTDQDKQETRASLIRAAALTPDESFNAIAAREKLHGGMTDAQAKVVIDDMLARKVLVPMKSKRVVPGRNFKVSEVFENAFKPTIDALTLSDARTYLDTLTAAITREPLTPVPVLQEATDGASLALLHLVHSRAIRLVPQSLPTDEWGWIEEGYQGRGEGNKLAVLFPLGAVPGPRWESTFSKGLLEQIPVPPQAQDGDGIRLWRDIHGGVVPEIWTRTVMAVATAVAINPGITTAALTRLLAPAVDRWDCGVLLAALRNHGLVLSRGELENGGWMVGKGWWV